LRNPDAPIPQFVNAMKMAGIEITAEQVAQGITYEALKDKDGNPFVVAVYNLDPSLFPEKYRDLAGPIPLVIARRRYEGWMWERARPDNIFGLVNIPVGIYLEPGRYNDAISRIATQNFNQLSLPIYWHVVFPTSPNSPDFSLPDTIQQIATQEGRGIFGGTLLWQNPCCLPYWVTNDGVTQEQMTSMIRSIIQRYPSVTAWICVNEPHQGDFFASRMGYPDYVINAFRIARQYTDAPLLLNDFGIESHGSKYQNIRNLVEVLKAEGLIDGIGIQMHVDPQILPSVESLIENFRSWDIPVYITELDVPTSNEMLKAHIFSNIIGATIESGVVRQINYWGLGSASWQENATLFDSNNQSNLSYFAVLKTVIKLITDPTYNKKQPPNISLQPTPPSAARLSSVPLVGQRSV
jgi:GH35 family endo-1,4-beta-xylanase